VLAHEARARIGRPRQQRQASGIGDMAYEIMARNCSEKNLNSGKIAATLGRAGQIIQIKSIDQQEQTQTIEETISNHGEPSAAYRPQPNWRTGSITQYEAIACPSVLPSLTILLKKQDFRG